MNEIRIKLNNGEIVIVQFTILSPKSFSIESAKNLKGIKIDPNNLLIWEEICESLLPYVKDMG